jgi:hypothetical protein
MPSDIVCLCCQKIKIRVSARGGWGILTTLSSNDSRGISPSTLVFWRKKCSGFENLLITLSIILRHLKVEL